MVVDTISRRCLSLRWLGFYSERVRVFTIYLKLMEMEEESGVWTNDSGVGWYRLGS